MCVRERDKTVNFLFLSGGAKRHTLCCISKNNRNEERAQRLAPPIRKRKTTTVFVRSLCHTPIYTHITFERVNQWMDTVKLQLAQHKIKAVLITCKQEVETITLESGEHEITSQSFIRLSE